MTVRTVCYKTVIYIFMKFDEQCLSCYRLRDERGDIERVIAMDKAREGSHNGNIYKHFCPF